MKSKKLIGFIAVLAVIAVVFAGSAAAVTTTDNAIIKGTSDSEFNSEAALMIAPFPIHGSSYAALYNLDSDQVAVRNLIEPILLKQDVSSLTALNGTALGDNQIFVTLNKADTNTNRIFNLAQLNSMDSSDYKWRWNLNSNYHVLPLSVSNLNDADTNAYGSYYLADLYTTDATTSNVSNLNNLGTNSFLILPVSVSNLNTINPNLYGYFNLAQLNSYTTDVNSAALNSSVAVSVSDLTNLALNTGNMTELSTFLAKLNNADTNAENTTLHADLNTMKTNLDTTADVNADTNKKHLSAASGTTFTPELVSQTGDFILIDGVDAADTFLMPNDDVVSAEEFGLQGKIAGVDVTDDLIGKGVVRNTESTHIHKIVTSSDELASADFEMMESSFQPGKIIADNESDSALQNRTVSAATGYMDFFEEEEMTKVNEVAEVDGMELFLES